MDKLVQNVTAQVEQAAEECYRLLAESIDFGASYQDVSFSYLRDLFKEKMRDNSIFDKVLILFSELQETAEFDYTLSLTLNRWTSAAKIWNLNRLVSDLRYLYAIQPIYQQLSNLIFNRVEYAHTFAKSLNKRFYGASGIIGAVNLLAFYEESMDALRVNNEYAMLAKMSHSLTILKESSVD